MKVKELIEELKQFDPEFECIWEDVIEGDDSWPLSIRVEEKHGEQDIYDGKGFCEENIVRHEDGYPALYFFPRERE